MLVDQIVKAAGQPMPEIKVGDVGGTVERASDGISVQRSAWTGALETDKQFANAGRLEAVDATVVSEDTQHLMREIDPVDPALYKHLRYFAQTQNRRGFTYSYTAPNGEVLDVTFHTGVHVTRDRALVDSLSKDILRPGGIGAYIQEISGTVYEEMQRSARLYEQLRAVPGATGSNMIDPHQQMRQAETDQLRRELEATRRQLRDVEAVLANMDESARKALLEKSGERAALVPSVAPPAPTPSAPVDKNAPTSSDTAATANALFGKAPTATAK